MSKPKLLDLFCCQGGASEGYRRAGFDVYGVDIETQPKYPFAFYQGDALVILRRLLLGEAVPFTHRDGRVEWLSLSDFTAIHASPPCQLYSITHKINRSDFPDLIEPTRSVLQMMDIPWVIENVEGARSELRDPVTLCGAMFGLRTYRHRLFESNFPIAVPTEPEHEAPTTKMGRPVREGEFMHVVGNFSGAALAREVMDMPWATRDGLREAVPPAYTGWIGDQLMEAVHA